MWEGSNESFNLLVIWTRQIGCFLVKVCKPDTLRDLSLTLSLSTSPTPSRGDSWLVHSRRGWKKLEGGCHDHSLFNICVLHTFWYQTISCPYLHVLRVMTTPMFWPRIWSRSFAQRLWNSSKLLANLVVLSEIRKRNCFCPDSSKFARKATILIICRISPVSISFTLLCSQ